MKPYTGGYPNLPSKGEIMSQDVTQDILTQAVEEVIAMFGKVVLAELERRLPLSRQQLRRLQKHGFKLLPNGNSGKKKTATKISPFSGFINSEYLAQGITNSSVIFDTIRKKGYKGGLTAVKDYISSHQDLIPARRTLAVSTPNRGRRYETGPGEMFQMDWGFVNVCDEFGNSWKCACFAMVCHHCGLRYVEFFPSARQENLFIGMVHAFMVMGVPKTVLTDNMKSIVVKRLVDRTPVWNKEYEAFQSLIGFRTKLCKIAHPFTKGAVERLVRYVKENFIVGRTFINITDLNHAARTWCYEKNSAITRSRDVVPMEQHYKQETFSALPDGGRLVPYLAPMRKISWDGYVYYENRLYGVPLTHSGKTVRVQRTGDVLRILSPETHDEIYTHRVNWSRKPNNCIGQWSTEPEEHPTQRITSTLVFVPPKDTSKRFERFAILKEDSFNDK
jgi:transposase